MPVGGREGRAFLPDRYPLVIGHRGAPRVAAGNTLDAVTAAVELGADAIEIDVRRTADGHLILHHDATIGGADVSRTTLTQARALAQEAGFELATLQTVLERVDGVPLDVELKDPSIAAHALELVTEHRDGTTTLITSFHPAALRKAAEVAPSIRRGLLLSPGAALRLVYRRRRGHRLRRRAESAKADLLIAHKTFAQVGLMGALEAAQRPVIAWTVNRDRSLRRLLSHPFVAGVITDRTARALTLRSAVNGSTSAASRQPGGGRVVGRAIG